MAPRRLVTGTRVAERHSSAGRPRGARRARHGAVMMMMMVVVVVVQRAMQSRNSGKHRGNQLKQKTTGRYLCSIPLSTPIQVKFVFRSRISFFFIWMFVRENMFFMYVMFYGI